MKKLFSFVALASILAGGWHFYNLYTNNPAFRDQVKQLLTKEMSTQAPPARAGDTIRIASFNLNIFGEKKIANQPVMSRIVEICRHFDIIAVQEIRSERQDVMPQFIQQLNADGSKYTYIVGPRLGRTDSKEQYAFIYDTASIEADRNQTYTVDDPHSYLERPPLVGWFRTRGVESNKAFTFTLVDVHTQPKNVKQEIAVLDDVFIAVRDDGRNEDDTIMLGDFNAAHNELGDLGRISTVNWVIHDNHPTNTRQTHQYDNIVLDHVATVEYTGRGGVFDFMRQFNMSLDEALLISDHFPIWGEFSVYEGGAAAAQSQIAASPEAGPRR